MLCRYRKLRKRLCKNVPWVFKLRKGVPKLPAATIQCFLFQWYEKHVPRRSLLSAAAKGVCHEPAKPLHCKYKVLYLAPRLHRGKKRLQPRPARIKRIAMITCSGLIMDLQASTQLFPLRTRDKLPPRSE